MINMRKIAIFLILQDRFLKIKKTFPIVNVDIIMNYADNEVKID